MGNPTNNDEGAGSSGGVPNTLNKFLVAGGAGEGSGIVILNLPMGTRATLVGPFEGGTMPQWPAVGPLTPDEAITLAAWLVAVAGLREDFNRLLDAIERT